MQHGVELEFSFHGHCVLFAGLFLAILCSLFEFGDAVSEVVDDFEHCFPSGGDYCYKFVVQGEEGVEEDGDLVGFCVEGGVLEGGAEELGEGGELLGGGGGRVRGFAGFDEGVEEGVVGGGERGGVGRGRSRRSRGSL